MTNEPNGGAGRRDPAARPVRILLVEDEAMLRESLVRILTVVGYEVASTAWAKDARVLAEEGVDLLVTDIRLPDALGGEVAVDLRARFGPIPVVFTSGYPPDEDLFALGGTVRFVAKPFDPPTLLEAIEGALAGGEDPTAGGRICPPR